MLDSITLDKVRDALSIIDAQGHIILDNHKKPLYPSSWKESSSWLPIDDALNAYEKYGDHARGVAAIASYQLFIFDFDPLTDEHVEEAAKHNLTREYVENTRESIRSECLAHTYVENSHARGTHGVFLSSRSFTGRVGIRRLKTCFAIDVIHGNKYCHITGDRLNERMPVDYTDRIDVLLHEIEKLCPSRPAQNSVPHDEHGNIGVDWLTDGEAWAVLACQRPKTMDALGNGGPCNFSEAAMKAVGDLAKITNNETQAYRMLAKTPLVKSPIRCEQGKRDRSEKFEKRFPHWWQEAREGNLAGVPLVTRDESGRLPSIAHGRRAYKQIMACRSAPPPVPPAKVPTNDATGRVVDDVQSYLMCDANASYLEEDSPAPEHLERLISINTRAMKLPFRKFAAMSTIGIFSGLLGRKYKTEDGIAASMLLVLGAQSGSGKGEAFRFWPQHVNRLMRGLDPNRNNPICAGDVLSAEALHDIVQGGARVWLREECANQLRLLYGEDKQSTALRDKTNELFDASKPHSTVAPPGSIAARQGRKSAEIWNASLALVWSTTDDNLKEVMKVHGLLTGTGSRALFALHEGDTGDSVAMPDDALPGDARDVLTNALAQMCELDGEYDRGGGERADALIIKVPYSGEAAQLKRELETRLDKLRKAITADKLPKHHLIFIRAAMLAAKIALISAVVRSLFTKAPASISRDDYERALGYVLRYCGELVSNIDSGKIDTKLSDSHRVVLHRFNKLLRKTIGKKNEGYVSATELKRSLRYSCAEIERIANQLRAPAARIIDEAIGELMKVEAIRAVDCAPAEGGYKKPHYAAGDEFDATISSIMGQV